MESPCTRQVPRKRVLLLLVVGACLVLPGFPARLNADIGTKKLKRAIEHFQQGSSLCEQKRFDDAIAEYRKALHDDPKSPTGTKPSPKRSRTRATCKAHWKNPGSPANNRPLIQACGQSARN